MQRHFSHEACRNFKETTTISHTAQGHDRTDQVILGKQLEGAATKDIGELLVSYGGLWGAWFLSFMAGNYVAAILGTVLCFNWMYTPWLHAKKRNAKMWPATGEKIYYALFMGRIKQLKRVKRRAGKSIGAIAQEYLLLLVEDEKGRELEVVTQWESA